MRTSWVSRWFWFGLVLAAGVGTALAAGEIRISERGFDAGEIELGEVVSHDFVIENVGTAPVQVTSVRAQCGCTVVDYPEVIQPGESGAIEVRIETDELHTGKTSKTVTVVTDATNEQRIVFQMKMRLHTALEFLPKPMVYLRTELGSAASEKLLVRPHRDGMKISDVRCEDENIAVRIEEAVDEQKGRERSGVASLLLPREGDSWIVVEVKPSAPTGFHRAEVIVETTDPEHPQSRVNVAYSVEEAGS
jgi:hypothetical protein